MKIFLTFALVMIMFVSCNKDENIIPSVAQKPERVKILSSKFMSDYPKHLTAYKVKRLTLKVDAIIIVEGYFPYEVGDIIFWTF